MITRRGFLKGLVAVAAVATMPVLAQVSPPRMTASEVLDRQAEMIRRMSADLERALFYGSPAAEPEKFKGLSFYVHPRVAAELERQAVAAGYGTLQQRAA